MDARYLRCGVCRHCGCDGDHACELPNGQPCAWIDRTHTVCSNPDCVKANRGGDPAKAGE